VIPDFGRKLGIVRQCGCMWPELHHQGVHLLLGLLHLGLLVLEWGVWVAFEITSESTNDRLNKE